MKRRTFVALSVFVLLLFSIGVYAFSINEESTSSKGEGLSGVSPFVENVDIDSMMQSNALYDESYSESSSESLSYQKTLYRHSILRRDASLLMLAGRVFDPAKSGMPKPVFSPSVSLDANILAEIVTLNGNEEIWIFQFDHVPTSADANAIEAAGGEIVAYFPNNAWAVRATQSIVKALEEKLSCRFVGRYHPRLRMSKALVEKLKQPDALVIPVKLSTFKNSSAKELSSLLAKFGKYVKVYHLSDHEWGGSGMIEIASNHAEYVLAALSLLERISYLEYFPLPKPANSSAIWLLQSGNSELKSTPLFDAGITGIGQIYAAADSGLDTDGCQFRYGPEASQQTFANDVEPPASYISNPDNKVISYYVFPGAEAYDELSGFFHGTMTTGCAAGDNYEHLATLDDPGLDPDDGMAPGAQIVFQDVADINGRMLGLYYVSQTNMHKQAIASGASVHNNSYGLDPSQGGGMDFNRYDGDSMQIDDIMWRNFHYTVVFASGNAGPNEGTLGGEGSTSKNTIVVGASFPGWSSISNGDDLVSFSSRGPTADGRLKPDVVAPGIVKSATEEDCEYVEGETDVFGNPVCISKTDPPNDQCATSFTGGTSFSSPIVAGITLLVRQYYTDGFYPSGLRNEEDGFNPTNALIKATILNSCKNMKGDVIAVAGRSRRLYKIPARPSTAQGWGRIALDDTLYLSGDRRDMKLLADVPNDSDDGLATGDVVQFNLEVLSSQYPLKISLAWSDPPGNPNAESVLVNDLDLEVYSPSGEMFLGNVNMAGGWSLPVESKEWSDAINSDENVFIESPEPGIWVVKVVGVSVPGNGTVLNPDGVPRQGYALVASGDFLEDQHQLSDVRFVESKLRGGCDNDQFLDLSETAQVEVAVGNFGGGVSKPVSVSIDVDRVHSEIGSDYIEFKSPKEVLLGSLPSKDGKRASFDVRLSEDAGELVCGKKIVFAITIQEEGEAPLHETFEVVAHQDLSFHTGTISCEENICDPAPVISSVTPREFERGSTIRQILIEGDHLPEHLAIKFGVAGITYESIKRLNVQQIVLDYVHVSDEVPIGSYSVMLLNTAEDGGLWRVFDNLIDVVEPQMVDGDEDSAAEVVEGEDARMDTEMSASENNESSTSVGHIDMKASNAGCSGGSPAAGLLGLIVVLWLLRVRRRVDA